MQESKPAFLKYVFVCENRRQEGVCCAPAGPRLRESLKALVKEKGLAHKIRVSRSGCLDVCAEGPNILVMPDNVWFKRVSEQDLEVVLDKIVEGVKR